MANQLESPRLTPRATKILEGAAQDAARRGHSYVGSEHFLSALLRDSGGVAAHVLKTLGVTDAIRDELEKTLSSHAYSETSELSD